MNEKHHWTFRGVVLVVLGAVLFLGCQDQTQTRVQTRPQDLMEAPSEHEGEMVSVSGEVSQVFSPRSFTIGGTDFGQELLIISDEPIAPVQGRTEEVPAAEQDIVQVTGVVQRFDSSEFAQEYDVTLQDEVASEFQGDPVVVAQQGSASMHGIIVSPRLPTEDFGTITDLSRATDPDEQSNLRGRIAAFPNASVQEVVQEGVFWIGTDDDERLLVVLNPESTPEVEGSDAPSPGEEWALYGVFRELPSEGILRADWGLNESHISELEDQEVYVNAVRAEPAEGAPSEN